MESSRHPNIQTTRHVPVGAEYPGPKRVNLFVCNRDIYVYINEQVQGKLPGPEAPKGNPFHANVPDIVLGIAAV